MHPRWSRYISKHPSDPRECFSTPLHVQIDFLKIERQVSYQHCFKNAFFILVKLYNMKNSILSSNFRFLKNFQKVIVRMQGCRKTFSGVQEVLGNVSGPSRMHQDRFRRKKNFRIFSTFFKHFSKVFSLFLKHFGSKSRKKSIFFKMKPCIKNRLVEKLDMVT